MTDRNYYYIVENSPKGREVIAAYETYEEAFQDACCFTAVYDGGTIQIINPND